MSYVNTHFTVTHREVIKTQHPPSSQAYPTDILKRLQSPFFDNWQWKEHDLLTFLEMIFVECGALSCLKLCNKLLQTFLRTVKVNYNTPKFHNFNHAFCVTQMAYALMIESGYYKRLHELDRIVILIAALCHDLDHPGLNNDFQVKLQTPLAIMYNHQAPLENHHIAVTLSILRSDKTNILKNLDEETMKKVRSQIIDIISITDMDRHGSLVERAVNFHQNGSNLNLDVEHDKDLLFKLIMKCADLSNEIRPKSVAQAWSDRLYAELNNQFDIERSHGLKAPTIPTDEFSASKMQLGFLDHKVVPLFEAFANLAPSLTTNVTSQLKKTRDHYAEVVACFKKNESTDRSHVSAGGTPPKKQKLSDK
ncbi:hypothetical protein BKA69DRAFT_1024317 [Paraphysoderma sedebokerense]|nr:hypothetical protein BKA69DRAFT_1024317 [Paraphysoderma sedebokerense]